MFIAEKLRQENIAEYLLYMWQVEDTIRAYACNEERIAREYVPMFKLDEAKAAKMSQWYAQLCAMMRSEGVKEKGHIQINKNVVIQLTDLHQMLLKSVKYPEYASEFYKTLPIIVELRSKSGDEKSGEIETCFNALYGMMMMHLQGRQLSESTQVAMAQISKFVSLLATYFHKDKIKPLFDKEDYQ